MVMGDLKNPEFVVSGSVDSTGAFVAAPSQDKTTAAQVISVVNANLASGVATANSTATVDVSGRATLDIAVTAAGGGSGLLVQASSDGNNWTTLGGKPLTAQSSGLSIGNSISGTGIFTLNVSDLVFVRVTSQAGFTGSATLILSASTPLAAVSIDNPYISVAPAAANTQWQVSITDIVNTSTLLKASAGAGLRNYITDLCLSNSSATPDVVQLLDGATIIWQAVIPAGATVIENFSTPLKGTAATALNILSSVATTTLYASASGYVDV